MENTSEIEDEPGENLRFTDTIFNWTFWPRIKVLLAKCQSENAGSDAWEALFYLQKGYDLHATNPTLNQRIKKKKLSRKNTRTLDHAKIKIKLFPTPRSRPPQAKSLHSTHATERYPLSSQFLHCGQTWLSHYKWFQKPQRTTNGLRKVSQWKGRRQFFISHQASPSWAQNWHAFWLMLPITHPSPYHPSSKANNQSLFRLLLLGIHVHTIFPPEMHL